jgi:ABC-type transport system substrate-binding protein/class 3 adenylate cyclase
MAVTTTTTGERRIVSVLVADVAGSTTIAEQLGAERSKFLFDEVIRLMTEQVQRYDGTVAQLTGDGLIALFGAPVAHEDDSERAVRAGLAIQRALAQYAQEVEAAYGVTLSARVGVNTGEVVYTPEAHDGEVRYNALGDAVNVAARLQQLADDGGVVVGPTTQRQVESCFLLEALGERDLKGKQAPVASFRVTGVREQETATPKTALIGREFELTILERTMDSLVEGRGTIVSLTGEPGIGKTRLVVEVRSRFRDRVRFIEGRAASYGHNFPYWPIRDLLREWLGVGATTPEARVRLELKAELAQLFGTEDADEAYPFFASQLGLTLEPDAAQRLRDLNRESIQNRTFEIFYDWACKLSADTPLCLVFEDLHAADEATLELLESLLPVTEEAAVALFFLYRSEREHGSWRLGERARQRFPHRHREIELRPLPLDASRLLIGNAAEGEVPDSVAELLAERSGGNPFFLEEAFRDLVERGVLERRNGDWTLAVGVDELAVPALVQGALQARLDRLDPKTREVVNVAAVIGRTFGMPLLESLVPHDELVHALTELQRLDLIVEVRRRPHPEYRFRHGLVQEVAYASLVQSKRKKLHHKVGDALEEIFKESPEQAYGLLARNFEVADVPEKAVEYLLKAGDAARAIYADQEALEYYRKAREFLARTGDERRARDTLFKMALTYHVAFDFENAEDLYDEAFCCRVEEDPRHEPTERVETAEPRFGDLAPGDVYSLESLYFSEHLYRGLLMVDTDLNVVPAMADNMRVSSDGREYLFRLREDARWSDGEPLKADDFAFAWRSMAEEQTVTSFMLENIEEANALDDRTLEVRLREPRSYFPYLLSAAWSFPWPRHKCEELGEDWRKPENLVGNGPFVLAEHSDEHALMVANPYWGGPRGNVREIYVSFTREEGEQGEKAAQEWMEGRYDILQTSLAPPAESPNTVTQIVPELHTAYVGFRADRPPFSNKLVRKAFSHAVDREVLTRDSARLALAATKGGALPPAMPGHSHKVGPEFDVELARRLLADAGYPEGRGLPKLTLALAPRWATEGEMLASQWAALGAEVEIRQVSKVVASNLTDEQLWISGWWADYPDPDGFFRGLLRVGWPFFQDEDIAELLDEGQSLRNQDERMRVYHEIDHLWVAEQAAILPLSYGRDLLLRRPWIEGVRANPLHRPHLDGIVVSRSDSASK